MFLLAPHPKLDKPQRGSPRMFRVAWIERYLSRVRWWHVLVVWGPVALGCLGLGAFRVSWPALLGMTALGMLAWTLLEYGLHRYVFHFKPDENSEFQRDLSFLIHGIHHDYPWDADRLVMPPVVSAVIAVAVWLPSSVLFGRYHYGFFAGVVMGYLGYDLMHYYLHHGVPRSKLVKWLRRYHLVHHFATPQIRYGITSPLWDVLFGTYPTDDKMTREALDEVGDKRVASPEVGRT